MANEMVQWVDKRAHLARIAYTMSHLKLSCAMQDLSILVYWSTNIRRRSLHLNNIIEVSNR